ncbi:hypothetical protein A4A49_57008, partial [Nicotiana attenuata]
MKERKQAEEKTLPKRVKGVAKKAVLPLGSVTLGGRIPIMGEAALEKDLEESKKKKKNKGRFRLINEYDVEEVDLVSEDEEEEGEEEEEEKMREKIASLKEENRRLKDEMKKEQEASAIRFDRLLGLIHGESSSSKEPG